MQYILMCCFDEKRWEEIPESRRDAIMRAYGYFVQSLVSTTWFCDDDTIAPARSETALRMKNGKTVLTDGPVAETKEQLGGYHIVDCADLNEAISIAARIPTLPAGGTIEVRCVADLQR